MSEYEHLVIERDGGVATLTLNRPAASNALNVAIMEEIEAAAQSFRRDEETRVVIFAGAGKHFSAGADLKQPPAPPQNLVMARRQTGLGGRMLRAILEIDQVTIAAVQGAALGGGACIPTACDFRIASHDAFIGYPEVNLGINLMWVGLPLVVRLVGPARAKRMIMLGEQIKAETLLEWGYVDQVVPRDTLLEAATSLANRYASQPPIPVQMIKRSVNAVANALDSAVMHMDYDQNILTSMTEDRREAVKAFFEKRDPVYKDR